LLCEALLVQPSSSISGHIHKNLGTFSWYLWRLDKKYQEWSFIMGIGKLSHIACQNAKYNTDGKGNKLSDGGGLHLHVKESGKYWRLSYSFLGKQKTLALGVFPRITLAMARDKREEAKLILDQGKDPNEEKKIGKLTKQVNYENNFENLAREWHKQNIHAWKPKHAERLLIRLENNVFPLIGKRPIKALTPPELLAVVRKVEERGAIDLAHRTMQVCSQIFRYAVATGRAERDITADLRGALKPAKSVNLARLNEADLPAFLRKLERYEEYGGGILTKLAFKIMILTFVRSGEIRGATWEEIDFEKAEWRIPAERMKMKELHVVPLARQTIEILKQVRELTKNNYGSYLFPSRQSPRKIMSENTFLKAIDILGYKGKTTGHGFRGVASTILNENSFRSDVIERQLAHGERDQIRAAYNHAQYLPERKIMMQWYADYIDNALDGGKVIEAKFGEIRA
jgi:integrase